MYFLYSPAESSQPAVLIQQQQEPSPGETSERFFESLTLIGRFPSSWTFGDTLAEAVSRLDREHHLLVVTNGGIVIDEGFRQRLDSALEICRSFDSWALASPIGIELTGQVHSAVYASGSPSIGYTRTPKPTLDCGLDLFLINGEHLRSVLEEGFGTLPLGSFVQAAVIHGYMLGKPSLFLAELAVGILGSTIGRSIPEHNSHLQTLFGDFLLPTSIPSLSGAVSIENPPLDRAQERPTMNARLDFSRLCREVIVRECSPTSVSVVTRTRFERDHLLRRLLTSLTRARRQDVKVEVILSTDVDEAVAGDHAKRLVDDFPYLEIRLKINAGVTHSRVDNLLGGIRMASADYIAIVDDDDYLDPVALEILQMSRFRGDLPVVISTTRLHNETWHETAHGWVLSSSTVRKEYPSHGWRAMFSGSNQLPICAMLLPREWALKRLEAFSFAHDLSEDYTMFLLMLSSASLPMIREVPDIFTHVSIRDDTSNTVTQDDRRQWVQDISLYLHDLVVTQGALSEGAAQLLVGTYAQEVSRSLADHSQLADANQRLLRELRSLRRENSHLRDIARRGMSA